MELTAFSLISYMLLAGFLVLVGLAGIKALKRFIVSNKSVSEDSEDIEDSESSKEQTK